MIEHIYAALCWTAFTLNTEKKMTWESGVGFKNGVGQKHFGKTFIFLTTKTFYWNQSFPHFLIPFNLKTEFSKIWNRDLGHKHKKNGRAKGKCSLIDTYLNQYISSSIWIVERRKWLSFPAPTPPPPHPPAFLQCSDIISLPALSLLSTCFLMSLTLPFFLTYKKFLMDCFP